MESSYLFLKEFRGNPAPALGAAKNGAVYLAEKGYPEFVLLNYEDYRAILRLARLPDQRHDELMVSFNDEPPAS